MRADGCVPALVSELARTSDGQSGACWVRRRAVRPRDRHGRYGVVSSGPVLSAMFTLVP